MKRHTESDKIERWLLGRKGHGNWLILLIFVLKITTPGSFQPHHTSTPSINNHNQIMTNQNINMRPEYKDQIYAKPKTKKRSNSQSI